MMNVPQEAVRDAITHKRPRAEVILTGDRVGVSIPLSAMAEFWNLPREGVRTNETEAGQGAPHAPALVVTPIISRGSDLDKHPRQHGPPPKHRTDRRSAEWEPLCRGTPGSTVTGREAYSPRETRTATSAGNTDRKTWSIRSVPFRSYSLGQRIPALVVTGQDGPLGQHTVGL